MRITVQILILILFSLFGQLSVGAQSGQWIWMKGNGAANMAGNYGVKGVASSTNMPPNRYQCAYWIDQQGNFWVFGGDNIVGNIYNDLWKYDPLSNEWTWMNGPQGSANSGGIYGVQGVPSILNYPGASGYGANCWTDNAGDLWLFAGGTGSALAYDDLWRYHIPTNEWTWMKGTAGIAPVLNYGPLGVYGPAYSPSARVECKAGWTVNDELWFFGGSTDIINSKADLWSYDISTNNWAWQGGTQQANFIGSYGVKGVASAANLPPSRWGYSKWMDEDKNLYLFAGMNVSATGYGHLNDVWKYDRATKLWTWISGSDQVNEGEVSTTYCDPQVASVPLSRFENQSAQTASSCTNAFWAFGGWDIAFTKCHNDLWIFNADNLEWTWVSGEANNGSVPTSSYGVQGVANPANMIPPRGGSASWSDAEGNFWVFGGVGGASLNALFYNDLWKFIPDTTCFNTGLIGSVKLSPPTQTELCPGDTIQYPVSANAIVSVSPSANTSFDPINNVLNFFGEGTYTVIGMSSNPNDPCLLNDTITFTITTPKAPQASFEVNPKVASVGQGNFNCINLSTDANAYEWYQDGVLISNATDISPMINEAGEYCIRLKAFGECDLDDDTTQCVKVIESGNLYMPNAFSPNGDGNNETIFPIIKGNIEIKDFQIFNRWGENIFRSNAQGWNGTHKNEACEVGTYFYMLTVLDQLGEEVLYKGDINLIR